MSATNAENTINFGQKDDIILNLKTNLNQKDNEISELKNLVQNLKTQKDQESTSKIQEIKVMDLISE